MLSHMGRPHSRREVPGRIPPRRGLDRAGSSPSTSQGLSPGEAARQEEEGDGSIRTVGQRSE